MALMPLKPANDSDGCLKGKAPKPTALWVAAYRAVHQILDKPLVFEDPLVMKLLDATGEGLPGSDLSKFDTPLFRGLRTSVVVRSRLAEDEWARSKQSGVHQYVILGAGLDTYAYRHLEPDGSRIFEVDLPETQQWKRDCLKAAGIGTPACLTFVSTDFERSTLSEALGRAKFNPHEAAFFSWLGVTMYLDEDAVLGTLRYIASLGKGSGVVFDYMILPTLLSEREQRAVAFLKAGAALGGEPWKTYFDPDLLTKTLRALGFGEVEDLGPEALNNRYFSGRTDGLLKGGASRLVCARVS